MDLIPIVLLIVAAPACLVLAVRVCGYRLASDNSPSRKRLRVAGILLMLVGSTLALKTGTNLWHAVSLVGIGLLAEGSLQRKRGPSGEDSKEKGPD